MASWAASSHFFFFVLVTINLNFRICNSYFYLEKVDKWTVVLTLHSPPSWEPLSLKSVRMPASEASVALQQRGPRGVLSPVCPECSAWGREAEPTASSSPSEETWRSHRQMGRSIWNIILGSCTLFFVNSKFFFLHLRLKSQGQIR